VKGQVGQVKGQGPIPRAVVKSDNDHNNDESYSMRHFTADQVKSCSYCGATTPTCSTIIHFLFWCFVECGREPNRKHRDIIFTYLDLI
jgi:hypothetical protein